MCINTKDIRWLFNGQAPHIEKAIENLAKASREGNNAAVTKILDQHPDIINEWDIIVYVHQSPLMHAAANGHLDTMKLLIERGADVNIMNENGWTPLEVAARWGTAEATQLLIDNGANVNPSPGRFGNWPPLMEAVWCHQSDTVKVLVANGADLNAKDRSGKTALTLAEEALVSFTKDMTIKEDVKARVLKATQEIIDTLKKGAPPKRHILPKNPGL